MKTSYPKSWSLLSFILMAASAIAAAVLPKNSIVTTTEFNGSLTATGVDDEKLTCSATDDISADCFASTAKGSYTTVTNCISSGLQPTINNTTIRDDK